MMEDKGLQNKENVNGAVGGNAVVAAGGDVTTPINNGTAVSVSDNVAVVGNNVENAATQTQVAMPLGSKKKAKWPFVVLGVVVILALVGGVVAILAMRKADSEMTNGTEGENGAGSAENGGGGGIDGEESGGTMMEEKKEVMVQKLVAEVKVQIEKDVAEYGIKLNEFQDENLIYYRPEGFEVAIALNRSYGFEVAGQNEVNLNELENQGYYAYKEIGEMLENKGFVRLDGNYATGSAGSEILYVNEGDGIVCGVPFWGVSLSCAATDWYDKDDAELSNELAKVYNEATGENATLLRARVADIKNSPVAPYQNISVGMQGFGAMFYRMSPEAEWVYFTSGQMGPSCEDFNTDDVRKAFAGESCWSEGEGFDAVVEP